VPVTVKGDQQSGVQVSLGVKCPACGAAVGQQCRRRNDHTILRPWPHRHRTRPPEVLIDVDGVVADMNPFAFELDEGDTKTRWSRFFHHLDKALLVEQGADLVRALHGLGVPIRYSTTRPGWTVRRTREWIRANDLPDGYLYARSRPAANTPRTPGFATAADVKIAHATEVMDAHGLAAFIDDEPEAVSALCASGVNALLLSEFEGLTTSSLRALVATWSTLTPTA
jgi:hypothetical protein